MASLKKLILLLATFCAVALLMSSGIVATNKQTKEKPRVELSDYPGHGELPTPYGPTYYCPPYCPDYGRRFSAKGVHGSAAKTDKDGPKN